MAISDNLTRQSGPKTSVASDGSPLVHPQETSDPFGHPSSFRHFSVSGCRPAIEAADWLYNLVDGRGGTHRLARFRGCRTVAWFVRHVSTHEVRVASSSCKMRWCPLCQRSRRFIIGKAVVPFLKNHAKPKFITLTLKHSSGDLTAQISRLYDSFKLLRRSKLWRSHIKGGVWFFQVKRSITDGLWHPHLHICAVGRYLPQDLLSAAWLNVTGDSSIVDIRAVKDPKKTADYVARYATAPCALKGLDDADLLAVYDALHGRRICGTFGAGKEIQLVPKKCPDADDWENIGTFFQVVAFRHTDENAMSIFRAWTCREPVEVSMVVEKPPPRVSAVALEFQPFTYKQFVFEFNGIQGRK